MKIAILGAGNVGGGLGAGLAAAGHDVTYGVRDPDSEKTQHALAATRRGRAASPAEAGQNAEVVIFALRWDAVAGTVTQLTSLDGTVVIDAMNRFDGDPARSTAEDLAGMLPGARLVKAFNTIGFENFTTAKERQQKAAMFICGDDEGAKRVAMQLATDLGFVPEDVGPLSNAKALEGMVKIWLALAARHGRDVGF
ncbi:MAG: NAD(P)-binding domain-containing protein, partial [Chloroflexota bacterium]|nr:NAD(P)-binding domain-containing protein [Chloroflexota bacterium]